MPEFSPQLLLACESARCVLAAAQYCDRVLHRSMPGCSELLQLLRFDSAPDPPTEKSSRAFAKLLLGNVGHSSPLR